MKGSIIQRGPNSFRVEISTGERLPNGRYKKIRRSARSKEEAKKILAELNLQLLKGDYTECANMTVNELFTRWLKHCQMHKQPKTYEFYSNISEFYVLPEIGTMQIAKVKPITIRTLLDKWTEEGKSKGTVKHIKATISAAFGWACELELADRNPALKVSVVDPDQGITQEDVWDEAQIRKILGHADEEYYGIYFWIALLTGMRQNEILALKWSNVDFKNNEILVIEAIKQNDKSGVVFGPPKTKRGRRRIAVPPILIRKLKQHKAAQNEDKLKAGADYDDQGLVVANRFGKVVNSGQLRKVTKRLAQKAKVPYIPPRNLRHTHATWLLAANINPKSAQERLGHEKERTFHDNYTTSLPNMQREIADTLDERLTI